MLIVADNPLRDPRGLYRMRIVCSLVLVDGVTVGSAVEGSDVVGEPVGIGAAVVGVAEGVAVGSSLGLSVGFDVDGPAVGASVGGLILHGGGLVSQLRPFASIFDGQHSAAPPGLVSHPTSIHRPHDAEQH